MKRGGPLRRRSNKQSARMRNLKKDYETTFRAEPTCWKCGGKATEPHHPRGRKGSNLFFWIPLCHSCHTWVHRNPRLATEAGLLLPDR